MAEMLALGIRQVSVTSRSNGGFADSASGSNWPDPGPTMSRWNAAPLMRPRRAAVDPLLPVAATPSRRLLSKLQRSFDLSHRPTLTPKLRPKCRMDQSQAGVFRKAFICAESHIPGSSELTFTKTWTSLCSGFQRCRQARAGGPTSRIKAKCQSVRHALSKGRAESVESRSPVRRRYTGPA
ncbi:hypothetical protein LMG28614_03686 [Paraburkholderia ultramafica]|uniref:Uncharacterized protein n=1 Tax=Paraburkholderia ultramafica TaxID=1544867 RepID=A0A6S7D150_9BURK|nr:hypothetical protein LMG28614_03686 [Paraburkholderia ultramafica]